MYLMASFCITFYFLFLHLGHKDFCILSHSCALFAWFRQVPKRHDILSIDKKKPILGVKYANGTSKSLLYEDYEHVGRNQAAPGIP